LVCPHCGADARCVDLRTKWVDSLFGALQVERHYYHCRAGSYPVGERPLATCAIDDTSQDVRSLVDEPKCAALQVGLGSDGI
jgi:hypothetical protein